MSGNIVPILFANVCGSIFVLFLLALGIFLVIFNLRSKKKAEGSQNWPSTAGSVTLSEVKQTTSTDDDGHESHGYYPLVNYTYQVAGQNYTGKNITFGSKLGYNQPAKASADLARYPLGAAVSVYYDPQKPSDAVLERRAGGFKLGLVIGIICLVLGVCIGCGLLIPLIRTLTSGA